MSGVPAEAGETRLAPVARHGLLDRLDALPDTVRVVLLNAPVGYGKTTAVRQWLSTRGHPAGWLTVTRDHDDRLRFVRDVVQALGSRDGRQRRLDVPHLVPVLAAAFTDGGAPRVLVLDDLHRLRRGRSLDLLTALSEQVPAGSRIVAMADRRPRWRAGRLLAEGHYQELGVDDLAFTAAETRAYLRLLGLVLPDAALDELVRRVQGWPTGLRLAAHALQRAPDPVAAVHDVSGASGEIAHFFRSAVLASLPEETVGFLRRSAVLGDVSGPLCDAALDMAGSGGRLAEVHAAGLFLLRRDERDEWYRYHRLFAETLTSELRRVDPRAHRDIGRRASRWYSLQGHPAEAIDMALAGGHTLTAARLIVAHTQLLNSRGQIDRVRGWIETLEADALELYPPIAVMATWAWALTGDAARARRALQIAETGSFDGPLPDGSASLRSALLRARAVLAPDGVERMLADAREAVTLEPPGSRWHTQAALLRGVAEMVNGRDDAAVRWLEHAAHFGEAAQTPGALTALAELALLAARRQDWTMAELCLRDCVQRRDAGALWAYMPGLLGNLAAAVLAATSAEADAGERLKVEMAAALALYAEPSPDAIPWLGVQSAVILGHLFLVTDEVTAAQEMLADARRHLSALPTTGAMAQWVEELATAVGTAAAHTVAEDASGLTAAELRVLPHLPSHLSLGQIADLLGVSRNTVKSHVASIYAKLGAAGRAEAVALAQERGLLEE